MGLLIAFALAEGLLRWIPTAYTRYNSTVSYIFDARIGYKLTPGQRSIFSMACFKNEEVSVNSHGFRDAEWRGGRRFKIGVLGDSFMEGLQVPDDSTTAAHLEELTGVEVLNTGLSGFGTVGEFDIYTYHLKAYRPDVLLLFYYPPNDLINNHCELNQLTHNAFFAPGPCATPDTDGITFQREFADTLPQPGWLWQHSRVWRAVRVLTYSGEPMLAAQTFDAYLKPYEGKWAEAQNITEQTLEGLRDTSALYGSRLVVVTVPSFLSQTQGSWEPEIMAQAEWDQIPANFDKEYPNQVIRTICDSLELPMIELEPVFRGYRDANALPDPTFFFECNGHWNSLGHRLAAETVIDSLKKWEWLPEQNQGSAH